MELNEKQKEVVYTHSPYVFLLAGAGSGKTRVLIERIKFLLSDGINPGDILAITFTHKASIEMQERLNHKDVNIHTFHQFAYRILKEKSEYDFKIYDSNQKRFSQRELLEISIYKNHLFKSKKPKIFDIYESYLKENQLKDFDDLLIDLYQMTNHKRTKITYQYIFVDEFQDTNELQYMILKSLITPETKVLAVGDPDQSIYQFRGANSKIIDRFIRDFHAEVKVLDMNYRSSPEIIEVANRFIEKNLRHLKKSLKPNNIQNFEMNKETFETLEDEADFIVNRYRGFILDGVKPEEIAVIYRNHRRSFVLKNKLKNMFVDQIHGLKLMTMHQAKGLEFDVVFIMGLEKGECPSYHSSTYFSLEEERRLMYVAITRAKKYLYLTYTKKVDDIYKMKSTFYKSIPL